MHAFADIQTLKEAGKYCAQECCRTRHCLRLPYSSELLTLTPLYTVWLRLGTMVIPLIPTHGWLKQEVWDLKLVHDRNKTQCQTKNTLRDVSVMKLLKKQTEDLQGLAHERHVTLLFNLLFNFI